MESNLLERCAAETEQLLRNKQRMDTTRNVAVLLLFVMIVLFFAFTEPTGGGLPFYGSLAVFALALFEAHLFRVSAVSERRVKLIEQNFLPSLFGQQQARPSWQQELTDSYVHPLKPSFLEALAYRIHKNYFLIYLAVDTSWLAKVYLSPAPAKSLTEYVHRLELGFFQGWGAVGFTGLFWGLFVLALIKINKAKKQKDYLNGY